MFLAAAEIAENAQSAEIVAMVQSVTRLDTGLDTAGEAERVSLNPLTDVFVTERGSAEPAYVEYFNTVFAH